MARRIASLLSAATEMLFTLGLGDRVVAVSHECDWPAEANRLPRVTISHIAAAASSAAIDTQVRELSSAGKPLYGLDVELLGRLEPDLIVTQQQCDVCAVSYSDVLAAVAADPRLAGCRIIALNPQGLGDVLTDLRASAKRPQRRTLPRIASRRWKLESKRSASARPSSPRTSGRGSCASNGPSL